MSSQLSLVDVFSTNLTCPIPALKHSPSKRTKSVKSKPTSQPPGQAGGSGSSGQDCSAPPSKEGKTYILLVTFSIAVRHPSLGCQVSLWLQTRSPGWQRVLLSPLSPRPRPLPPRPPSVSCPLCSAIGRGRGDLRGELRPLCPLAPRVAPRMAPPLPVEVGREC